MWEEVSAWEAVLKRDRLGATTITHYGTAARRFAFWMAVHLTSEEPDGRRRPSSAHRGYDFGARQRCRVSRFQGKRSA